MKALLAQSRVELICFEAGCLGAYLSKRAALIAGDVSFDTDFKDWISYQCEEKGRNFKPLNKYRRSYRARRKDGFSKEELIKVIDLVYEDDHHIDTNFKFLTPDFVLRVNIVERYLNLKEKKTTTTFNTQPRFNA